MIFKYLKKNQHIDTVAYENKKRVNKYKTDFKYPMQVKKISKYI